jgi:type IX secretion system PorP/SprF family membrane protein
MSVRKLITYVLSFFVAALNAQHGSDYVQYMFNGLLINPAYAGSHEALNVTGLYRRQWTGLKGSPVTLSFSGHTALRNKRHNVGVVVENERFGLFSHTGAGLAYAFRIPAGRGYIAIGARGGIDAYSYNWAGIRLADANDPSFTGVPTQNTYPDFSAGLYYHDRSFYAGVANPRMLGRDNGYFNSWNATAGYVARLGEDFRLKPAALIRYVPASPVSTNLSATIYYREIIGAGAGCTLGNSIMAYADIRINEQLNAGYGYQRQLNKLGTYNGGSHEVMLRYLFRYRTRATSARYF